MAKIRKGFVSNSSSSSFIIKTQNLTCEQANMILNHMDYAEELGLKDEYVNDYDEWHISFIGESITGYTSMDNFNMHEFLIKIGVSPNNIEMEYNG